MSKLNVFVWLTVKWVNSFQTAKLMFRRNSRIWRKGFACKVSSILFHQSKWCNRKVLRKSFSVSQNCSWTENYKLQTDDIHNYWRMECAPLIIPYHLHLLCISKVWSMLHHGPVGQDHNKNTTSCLHLTFLAFIFMFLQPLPQRIVLLQEEGEKKVLGQHCSWLICNSYPGLKSLLTWFVISALISNSCPNLKSLSQFLISLAPIWNLSVQF